MRSQPDTKYLLEASGKLMKLVTDAAASSADGAGNTKRLLDHSTRYYVSVSLLLVDSSADSQARYRTEAIDALTGIGKAMRIAGTGTSGKLVRLSKTSFLMIRLLKEKVLCC